MGSFIRIIAVLTAIWTILWVSLGLIGTAIFYCTSTFYDHFKKSKFTDHLKGIWEGIKGGPFALYSAIVFLNKKRKR